MPVAGCAIQNSFIVMGGPPQNKSHRTRTIKHGWQIKAVAVSFSGSELARRQRGIEYLTGTLRAAYR